VVALATLALVALCGCQTGGLHATSRPAVPRDGSARLIMYITDQPFVTAEPACRAVHALAKKEPFAGDYDALLETLRSAGWAPRNWSPAADQYLDRAAVAYMLCRACEVRTGLNWTLTGLGRYAWRELQYRGIAGAGGDAALMSGGEFVGTLLRAEDYLQRTGKAEVAPVELGSPPG
jgi:hypothetical protein